MWRWIWRVILALVLIGLAMGLAMQCATDNVSRERLWLKITDGHGDNARGFANLRQCLEDTKLEGVEMCVKIDNAVEKAIRR